MSIILNYSEKSITHRVYEKPDITPPLVRFDPDPKNIFDANRILDIQIRMDKLNMRSIYA